MSIHHLDHGDNDHDGDDGSDDPGDNGGDDDDGGFGRTNYSQGNSYTMTDESMMMMMTTNLMMSCHSIYKFVEYNHVSLWKI